MVLWPKSMKDIVFLNFERMLKFCALSRIPWVCVIPFGLPEVVPDEKMIKKS